MCRQEIERHIILRNVSQISNSGKIQVTWVNVRDWKFENKSRALKRLDLSGLSLKRSVIKLLIINILLLSSLSVCLFLQDGKHVLLYCTHF